MVLIGNKRQSSGLRDSSKDTGRAREREEGMPPQVGKRLIVIDEKKKALIQEFCAGRRNSGPAVLLSPLLKTTAGGQAAVV